MGTFQRKGSCLSGSRQPPKPRTRKAMIAYLSTHYRYDTMRSWNRGSSYARCVKLSQLTFPDKVTEDMAYELVLSDTATDWWVESGVSYRLQEFATGYDYVWQIGRNGRSSGYLILYQGTIKPSQYRSYCTACRKHNFTRILEPQEQLGLSTPEYALLCYLIEHNYWRPEIYPQQDYVKGLGLSDAAVIDFVKKMRFKYCDDKGKLWLSTNSICGHCNRDTRVNYLRPPIEISCYPGKGTDEEQDYDDWDTERLKDRTSLVWNFDAAVEDCAELFVSYCQNSKFVTEQVYVPKLVTYVESKE